MSATIHILKYLPTTVDDYYHNFEEFCEHDSIRHPYISTFPSYQFTDDRQGRRGLRDINRNVPNIQWKLNPKWERMPYAFTDDPISDYDESRSNYKNVYKYIMVEEIYYNQGWYFRRSVLNSNKGFTFITARKKTMERWLKKNINLKKKDWEDYAVTVMKECMSIMQDGLIFKAIF